MTATTISKAIAVRLSVLGLCLLFSPLILAPSLRAQGVSTPYAAENTAFQSGESIDYELFYDWGIIWKKVGKASLHTTLTTYQGQEAYDIRLLTATNKTADAFFKMRDSLECRVSTKLEPLYYKKAAEESDRYSVDQAWYSYDGNKATVKQLRTRPGRDPVNTEYSDTHCIYDMLSIIARTRNYDLSSFTKGQKTELPLATGRRVDEVTLECLGTETIKAKNGVRYRCIGFSIYSYDQEDKKNEKILNFYVTDDQNHLPVRIDFFLKIGSAKAYLKDVSGNRHELSSVVSK